MAGLGSLLPHSRGFILYWLVLARAGGVFAVAPVVGSSSVPAPLRAAVALVVALAVLPAAEAGAPSVPQALLPYLALMVGEAAIGLVIGFVAQVVFSAAQMAGQLIDLQMGFSVGQVVDPVYGQATTVVGSLFNALAMLLFLLAGGLEVLVSAVDGSYRHLPIGAAPFFAAGAVQAVAALAWATQTAVQVAAPALALGLILNLLLGLVGRAVPQLNVFAAALPVQILAGLATLLLALPIVTVAFGALAGQTATWLGGLLP